MTDQLQLSRREREILDIVYARGEASVSDVLADITDPPTRTAVRTLMRILEEKGHLKHSQRGRHYLYRPTRARGRMGRSALRRVLTTFFDGSLEQAVSAHLTDPKAKLSEEQLARLAELIDNAKQRGPS